METLKKRSLQIPFTDSEWECFDTAMFNNGFKKQGYIRNLIIADLRKKGWLEQPQKEAAQNDRA